MIPDGGQVAGPPVLLVALGVAGRPGSGGSVVVAVTDLIAELERRVAEPAPTPPQVAPVPPRRHLRLVPPPA